MSTPVPLNDQLVADAASFAARIGRSVTEVIEDAVREKLISNNAISQTPRLTTFGTGGVLPGIDLSSNASIYDAMDADDAAKFGNGP